MAIGEQGAIQGEGEPGADRKARKVTKVGLVTSTKMDKTVAVEVESIKAHAIYRRTVRRSKRFLAHDPEGRCQVGDRVKIIESRPLSKRKRWRIVNIIQRARGAAEQARSGPGSVGA